MHHQHLSITPLRPPHAARSAPLLELAEIGTFEAIDAIVLLNRGMAIFRVWVLP